MVCKKQMQNCLEMSLFTLKYAEYSNLRKHILAENELPVENYKAQNKRHYHEEDLVKKLKEKHAWSIT